MHYINKQSEINTDLKNKQTQKNTLFFFKNEQRGEN